MSLFDHFPEQPAKDWSLAEEAAQYAPPLWSPAHVEPEGVTPLPADFPVADPFDRDEHLQRLIDLMQEHAICRTKDCALEDPEVLARGIAAQAVEFIGEFNGTIAVLFAHGETLLAEALLTEISVITNDLLRPYFERSGLDVEGP